MIVNPYGLSPLSALIQFDTETAEPVTVIVKGKQPQTDLTWTYEPSTSHCLPIIGLYPEQKTTVQLIVDDMVKELEIEGQARRKTRLWPKLQSSIRIRSRIS